MFLVAFIPEYLPSYNDTFKNGWSTTKKLEFEIIFNCLKSYSWRSFVSLNFSLYVICSFFACHGSIISPFLEQKVQMIFYLIIYLFLLIFISLFKWWFKRKLKQIFSDLEEHKAKNHAVDIWHALIRNCKVQFSGKLFREKLTCFKK